MQEILRWLAHWQGLELEPGTELHLALAGFPSGGLGLLVLLGVIAAVWVVVHSYRRDAHRLTKGRRALLMTLRLLAVLLACTLLLDPQVIAVRREAHPGHTLLLVDRSQSMGGTDSFADPAIAGLADDWRAAGVAHPEQTRRIDLARELLESDHGALLDALRARNDVLVYGFAADVEPLGVLPLRSSDEVTAEAAKKGEQAAPLDLKALTAEGTYTNLGAAVRESLARSSGANVAGVVILSDGRRNLGPQGAEVARLLKNRGVPHTIVVPIGDPSPARSLQIERVEAPDKVFQKDPFEIRAVIEGEGYDDTDVTVHLARQREGESAPTELRAETVHVGKGQPEATVTFGGLTDDRPGRAIFSVRIEPPALEAFAPERHVQRVAIEVLDERTRVLLIAGGPNPEYRILRSLLIRDDTIEVSCWLQSADADFPQDGNVSIESLPTERDKLAKYDVVVMMDPDSRKLDRGFCEMLADLVTHDGVGLWWVCGEKHTLDAVRDGATTAPLVELLPVIPDVQEADQSVGLARGMPRAWRFELTSAGRDHKVTRIADDRAASEAIWSRLPGFYFAFPVERAKPVAVVLVEHARPSVSDPTGEKPLIATQFVGAGRVLFSATDDTYRWRFAFESAYDRYWVKGIRYLYEGRIAAGGGRVHVVIAEERIELGEAVRVLVEARTPDGQPQIAEEFPLTVVDQDGNETPIVASAVEGAPGQFETWLRPRHTGWFRVVADTGTDGRPAEAGVTVVPAALEKPGPVDLAELGAIAAVDGGVLVARPTELRSALDQIESETRIESFTSGAALWDAWTTVALLLGILSVEWWLRKRSNLL